MKFRIFLKIIPVFFLAYVDKKIEDITNRSLIYLSDGALNHKDFNTSRGMVMAQLLDFMGMVMLTINSSFLTLGYKEELLRPDAFNYILPIKLVFLL